MHAAPLVYIMDLKHTSIYATIIQIWIRRHLYGVLIFAGKYPLSAAE